MRKFNKQELKVINTLKALSENWPDSLKLFGDNGTLIIIDAKTHMVLDDNFYIPCDGGDPDRSYDEYNNEYINA